MCLNIVVQVFQISIHTNTEDARKRVMFYMYNTSECPYNRHLNKHVDVREQVMHIRIKRIQTIQSMYLQSLILI